MARLNEPPVVPQPSAETIDVVKRRFLRQNRELAKTNSQQSIRIRSLENDCSRLLAENLSLREQVLHLHNAAESQSSRLSMENIDAVKAQLEAKLLELGGMVAQLGQLKKTGEQSRRKSQQLATRRSAGERQWRSGLGLQEVENQMLPTIAEGKHYPRRTMGADELREVLDDPDSQSPDIGPPPISRFEHEEPIAFNPIPTIEDQPEEAIEDGEPALPANLETRKKRRESGPKLDIRRVSVFESPPDVSQEEGAKATRTGSKRKFSVREDEDKAQAKAESFTFSRRNVTSDSEDGAISADTRSFSPERPILGSKPVNTDPVLSPKKQRPSVQEKQEKPEKPEKKSHSKSRGRTRLNITRTVTPPELPLLPVPESMPEPIPTAEINLDSLPPKTPFAEAVFSPPSTEPSTSRPENKDTPPPGNLSSADQTGMTGRPGRRARPAVSYKEPSLSTKMRRPDAKLVDAVIDRRTSGGPQTAPSTVGKADTKRGPDSDLGWKPVSAVSGRGEEEMEVGSPLRQKLDRREINQESKTTSSSEPNFRSSTASKAISALISETSIAKRKAAAASALDASSIKAASEQTESTSLKETEPTAKQDDEDKDSNNLAIFDFTDSSPVETTNPRTRNIHELAKAARNARRHSSVPMSSTTDDHKTDGTLPSLPKRTGSGVVKSASTTSLARSTSAARSAIKDKKVTLPASESTLNLKAKVDGVGEDSEDGRTAATSSLRQERAASRRKSMMI